jgi:hypothetical protein
LFVFDKNAHTCLSNQYNIDDDIEIYDDHIDLIGAHVKVNSGEFKGCLAIINERQSFRHVQIADPSHPNKRNVPKVSMADPVLIADVEILTPAPAPPAGRVPPTTFAQASIMKYMGADVRVLPSDPDRKGFIGTVAKVIVGDWYITDNPVITNAFRANKFDILRYPPGYATAKKLLADEQERRRAEREEKISTREKKRAEREKKRVEREKKRVEREKKRAGKDRHRTEREKKLADREKKRADQAKKRGTQEEKQDETEESADDDGKPSGTTSRNKTKREEQSNSVRSLAAAPAIIETSSEPDSLVGATILITQGTHAGKTGVVVEKKSMRRLQLDTLPEHLRFEDVTVLEYADNEKAIASGSSNGCTPDQNDFAQRYQRYMGARVKVVQDVEPRECAGVEGRVIRVVVLSDWYITDNPEMPVAFTRAKFDVIKYPPAYVENKEDGTDEDEAHVGDANEQGNAEGVEYVDRNEDESSNNDGSLKRKRLVDNDEEGYVLMKGDDGEEGDFLMKGDDINENNNGDLDSNSTGSEYDPGSPGGEYDTGSLDQESSKAGQHADISHDQNDIIDRAVTEKDDDLGAHHSHANDQEDGTPLPPFDPLVGASVYMDCGKFQGHSGTILKREARGWCTVSGMPIKIKINSFAVIDDGKVDIGAVEAFSRQFPSVMPRVIKPATVAGKRKFSEQDMIGDGNYARPATKHPHISNVSQSTSQPVLNPILLQEIPASLHYLPPDTEIEIFNRKTGRIMRGKDAILLKDLSRELMAHSEYEPIVPPRPSSKSRYVLFVAHICGTL